MAAPSCESRTPLIDLLHNEGHRFEFFQAVRLLQRFRDVHDVSVGRRARQTIGRDARPHNETIRFGTTLSSSFPASAIAAIDIEQGRSRDSRDTSHDHPFHITVNFMGLTGPQGVLPEYFQRLIIEQHRGNNDRLADFQNLFNHRMISMFYRVWEKYRFPVRYERAKLVGGSGEIDPFTQCLFCLVGMGTRGLRQRLSFDDQAFIYYGGLFAPQVRNADGLCDLLTDDLRVHVRIEQFRGQWLRLDQEDWAVLCGRRGPNHCNCQLGVNTVLGATVWDVQNKFRVVLGPLDYSEYLQLTPIGERFTRLCQLVRTYAGSQFDFDVQLILKKDQIPTAQLGRSANETRLGYNAFLGFTELESDFEDSVFRGVDVW